MYNHKLDRCFAAQPVLIVKLLMFKNIDNSRKLISGFEDKVV